MAVYEYVNEITGERREIVARMSNPPPEYVVFGSDGEWIPSRMGDGATSYRRVYGDFQPSIPGGKYPIVSNTLPRNIPGCDTDNKGRPIVRSHGHARELARQTGYTYD